MKNLQRIAAAVAFGLVVRSVLSVVLVATLVAALFAGGLSVDLRVGFGVFDDRSNISAVNGGRGVNSDR